MTDFPKTTRFKAATKLACTIAGVKTDRFNEAIHAGFYPCAPETTPGRARSFDVNDIIALRLYQRFLDGGMSAKIAGHKACSVRNFLHQHPEADQVYIVKTAFDDGDAEKGQYREGYLLPDFDVKERHLRGFSNVDPDVVSVEVFNFHYLRGRIVHAIEEAATVIGED